ESIVDFLLRMSASGSPTRIRYIPSLAFCIARRRVSNRPAEPPNKNWPQAFRRRHPDVRSRNNKAMAWERHDDNIYDKVVHWFEIIEQELRRLGILPENVYIDKTGVLVDKDDKRTGRSARVERTTVTAIECISADGM
ncbi:hypothetical protein COCVIDRAFT_116083, partial [Bipolaris victoriae FI3]